MENKYKQNKFFLCMYVCVENKTYTCLCVYLHLKTRIHTYKYLYTTAIKSVKSGQSVIFIEGKIINTS